MRFTPWVSRQALSGISRDATRNPARPECDATRADLQADAAGATRADPEADAAGVTRDDPEADATRTPVRLEAKSGAGSRRSWPLVTTCIPRPSSRRRKTGSSRSPSSWRTRPRLS
jgi:hypothetical protein